MRPNQRSHAMRRLHRRLPGNSHAVHFVRRAPNFVHCPATGQILHGIPHVRPGQIHKYSKSQRTVNRYYGGRYSHQTVSKSIRDKILELYTTAEPTE